MFMRTVVTIGGDVVLTMQIYLGCCHAHSERQQTQSISKDGCSKFKLHCHAGDMSSKGIQIGYNSSYYEPSVRINTFSTKFVLGQLTQYFILHCLQLTRPMGSEGLPS